MRRLSAWGVAVPLMLAGSQLGHQLAYRLAYPQLSIRIHMLAAAGHGYAAELPLILGVVGSITACMLAWTAVDAVRGGSPQPLPASAFAVLPVLGFTLQEFLERWLATGGLPWWMIMQPSFRIGLALQLPFGLAAFAAARLLLRAAHRLGRRAQPAPPPVGAETPLLKRPPRPETVLAVRPQFTFSLSTRGPPLAVR